MPWSAERRRSRKMVISCRMSRLAVGSSNTNALGSWAKALAIRTR